MLKNKYKIIIAVLALVAIIVSVLFGKEKIEQKDITITELKKQVSQYQKDNKTLSIQLENTKKEKSYEVVIQKNSDGSSLTTKKLNSKSETNKGTVDVSDTHEKGSQEITDSKKSVDKTLILTNPTKLELGFGIDNRTLMSNFINGNYKQIFSPNFEIEARYKSTNKLEYKLYGGKGLTNSDIYVGAGIKFMFGIH